MYVGKPLFCPLLVCGTCVIHSVYHPKGSPTQKKRENLGIAQKGVGVETLAQIDCGSSSVNIYHY